MDSSETINTVPAPAEGGAAPLYTRLFDTVFSPGKMAANVAEYPKWGAALLVAGLLVALQTALIPMDVLMATQRQAALESGQDIAEMPEVFLTIMRFVFPLFGLVGAALMTFFFSGLYTLIFAFVLGDEGRYRQYLAVTAHAWFVPAMIGLLIVPLKIINEDPQLTLNLGTFIYLPEGYWSTVLRMMDITWIWSALIIAQGARAIDQRRSFGSAASILIGLSVVFALVFARLFGRFLT